MVPYKVRCIDACPNGGGPKFGSLILNQCYTVVKEDQSGGGNFYLLAETGDTGWHDERFVKIEEEQPVKSPRPPEQHRIVSCIHNLDTANNLMTALNKHYASKFFIGSFYAAETGTEYHIDAEVDSFVLCNRMIDFCAGFLAALP